MVVTSSVVVVKFFFWISVSGEKFKCVKIEYAKSIVSRFGCYVLCIHIYGEYRYGISLFVIT